GLLGGEGAVFRWIDHDGGLHVETAAAGRSEDALARGRRELALDHLLLHGIGERTEILLPLGGRAWPQARELSLERAEEGVADVADHEATLDRGAILAGVAEGGPDDARGGALQIGVGQHDGRVLGAELEGEGRERLPTGPRHRLPAAARAGEDHEVEARADHRLARAPIALHELERALGDRLGEEADN